jgi:WXXGXW repeat (2 copies)
MKNFIRAGLLLAVLLAGTYAADAQVSVAIRIGPPPPPRVVRLVPAPPGPEFVWVEGYWYPVGRHYRWHQGYWTRPPYAGAHWVGPRHERGRFYGGYWDGRHGRFAHRHEWDRNRERDRDRYRDHH